MNIIQFSLTQGHFWPQCEFNIEFVFYHNEYLAKPLKSVSVSQIIHWRGRFLAFNNATIQRCSFLVLFQALEDLWMEFSEQCEKNQTKPYRKGQALQLGAISHSHAATHRSAVSVSEMRSRKRLNSTVITIGIPKSEHFSVRGFPAGSAGKESTCNAADLGSIPGLGRSTGEENGYPLHYSVRRVTKSQTRLSDFHITKMSPFGSVSLIFSH